MSSFFNCFEYFDEEKMGGNRRKRFYTEMLGNAV